MWGWWGGGLWELDSLSAVSVSLGSKVADLPSVQKQPPEKNSICKEFHSSNWLVLPLHCDVLENFVTYDTGRP